MPRGNYCCVRHCCARSHNVDGERINESLRFFRIPKVKEGQGEEIKKLTERRRLAWVAAIGLKRITFQNSSDGARVCSKHFHAGKPAYEMCQTDPDWAPSLNMGHNIKPSDTGRYNRLLARNAKKHHHKNSNLSDSHSREQVPLNDANPEVGISTQSQTDLTGQVVYGMYMEINRLLEENRQLREKLGKKEKNCNTFKDDHEQITADHTYVATKHAQGSSRM